MSRCAEELVRLLSEKNMTVAAAESLTGGMIAADIVSVPGASRVFCESYVTYSDEAKQRILGVSAETIGTDGAVSRRAAAEMVQGLAGISGCSLAISATGLAGPGGAEPGKPVGTVFLGIAAPGRTEVHELHLHGTREEIRGEAARLALKFALALLKGENG